HLISHHLEMMPPTGWDAALHGEQIAVATLAMGRLQEDVLARSDPPRVAASRLSEGELEAHFGNELGRACFRDIQPKLLDERRARDINSKLQEIWPSLREELYQVRRPRREIETALTEIGAPTTFAELGLTREAFCDAVRYARAIRNRYTFLDL